MDIHEFTPPPPLGDLVQLVWTLDLESPEDWGDAERILPDGIVEVVFHHAVPFQMRLAGERFSRQAPSFAISQTHRALEILPLGPGRFTSVRFRPWGFRHFAHIPLHALGEQMVPAEEIWGPDALELNERLGEIESPRARVALVESFLRRQLARHGRDGLTEAIVREIRRRRGRIGVAELGRTLGLGERRLQRICRDGLGTSPCHYARLTRFLTATAALRSGTDRRLADVAHACGFSDQAHFNRDFRAFAGMTPGEFLARERVSYLDVTDPPVGFVQDESGSGR